MLVNLLALLVACSLSYGDDYVINNHAFPENFMFGVSTASYQIEGAWNEDGKSPSIWDNFTHAYPDKVYDLTNGDIACDSYHKYETDVQLLKNLGVTHYRFSLSWPRILPDGFGGEVNEAGINYYKNLIKLLKQNNIIPLVTIFHWDLPQVIQDQDGLFNDSFAEWFANFARVCYEQFGDEVKYWLTFNEPHTYCVYGCGYGALAPGIMWPGQGDYLCTHNMLKAHAAAWHVYDKEFREKQGGLISLAHAVKYFGPQTDSPEDQAAAEQRMQFELGWFAEPVFSGDYPEIMKVRIANRSKLEGFNQSRLPEFTDEEKAFLKGTVDYFALNTYHSCVTYAIPEPPISLPPLIDNDAGVGYNQTEEGCWGMTPLLKWVQSHYGNPPIIVTENGLETAPGLDDDDRLSVIRKYMSRLRDAMDDGVNVFGYTVWTLMDNFEWIRGHTVRFGLHDVDFTSDDRTRTPKKSAAWYTNVIKTKCLVDNCE